jgi:hypothetical protein
MRSILALELCARFDPQLHAALLGVVNLEEQRLDYGARWQRMTHAGNVLNGASAQWKSGCWDFWDDNDKALSDFAMWVNGMMTREGARREPSGAPDVYRGEPRYLTFTIACLLEQGTMCERQLAGICNIPKSRLWQRQSFEQILQGLRHLSFAAVEKDTMYLIPRDPDWALTEDDLALHKFHYLRPIE